MAFYLVEECEVSAPRALERDNGGVITKAYMVWRCHNCHAMAVGQHESDKPAKCGKCKS